MPRRNKRTNNTRLARVSIRVEPNEPVDWDKFAWALLQYVKLTNGGDSTKRTHRPPRSPQP